MAQTVAEWELGIPPAPHIRSAMKRWKIKRFNSTLISCASSDAQTAVASTKFQLSAARSSGIGITSLFLTFQQLRSQQAQKVCFGAKRIQRGQRCGVVALRFFVGALQTVQRDKGGFVIVGIAANGLA